MSLVPRWSLRIIGVVAGFLWLPALTTGIKLLSEWAHVKFSPGPYFDAPYLTAGAMWTGLGLLGMSAAACAFLKRLNRSSVVPVILSFFTGLFAAISLPDVPKANPQTSMVYQSFKLLGHADRSLAQW